MSDYTARQSVPFVLIEYALCDALEGGSTYWTDRVSPKSWPEGCTYAHEAIARGSGFEVHLPEEEESLRVGEGKENVQKGIDVMAARYPEHFADIVNETGDANTGDVLFQCICFGEVVYG